MRDKVIKLIKKSFKANNVQNEILMDNEDVTIFVTGFELQDKNNIVTQIQVYHDHVKILGTLPNPVRYPHRRTVGEFLQRANGAVKLGYFLFDYEDFTVNFIQSFKIPSKYTDEAFRNDLSLVVQMLEYIIQAVKEVAGGNMGPDEALKMLKGGAAVEKDDNIRRDNEESGLQTGEDNNTGRNDSGD